MSSFQLESTHYRTLGLKRDTPWREIKERHRKLISECHPDRFGAEDPNRAASEERAKEINHAFQEIKRVRRNRATAFTKVELEPAEEKLKRPRAKTVERTVVVRNGVVYAVKKMRRCRTSPMSGLKVGLAAAGARAGNFMLGCFGRVRGQLPDVQKIRANRRVTAAMSVEAINLSDFSWSESDGQNVVHVVEGQRLVRNGSFRS